MKIRSHDKHETHTSNVLFSTIQNTIHMYTYDMR